MIVAHHYLHRGRTMAQVAYWILSGPTRAGVLIYAYPRLSVAYAGYRPFELLELARLWIDPAFQGRMVVDRSGDAHCLAIASRAIAQSLRRVAGDWQLKYPRLPTPVAVVAWADVSRHTGTIYRAANFIDMGLSGGRGHTPGPRRDGGNYLDHDDYRTAKRAFIYPLRREQPPAAMRQLNLAL